MMLITGYIEDDIRSIDERPAGRSNIDLLCELQLIFDPDLGTLREADMTLLLDLELADVVDTTTQGQCTAVLDGDAALVPGSQGQALVLVHRDVLGPCRCALEGW